MVKVEILSEKCTGCGLCAQDCPVRNLAVTGDKASVKGECMGCGHCFAICPAAAVRIPAYPEDGIETFQEKGSPVCGGDFLRLVKSRRSIRVFQDKPIERDTWEKLLEAGRFTATASNSQDVRYVVVQDTLEAVKTFAWGGFRVMVNQFAQAQGTDSPTVLRLNAMYQAYQDGTNRDPMFFNAPALLVITSASPLDGGLAASNIELMAHAEGLGALYSGFIQRSLAASEAGCAHLGIEGTQIRACLLLGWPNVTYRRSAPRYPASIQWK